MDSRAKMLLGMVLVLIGAFVTWVTYSAAAPGGRYVAFYGAIVAGAGVVSGWFSSIYHFRQLGRG
jgi:hypothetical protein